MTQNIQKLVAYIRGTLTDLSSPPPDSAYEYASIGLCAIDAVFSLGVRYESTERTVREWCARYGWEMSRARTDRERTITEFLQVLQPYENCWEDMARKVFNNCQRTSTRSGILKAEAVYRFCRVLQDFGIENFADVLKDGRREDLRREIKAIPGQGTGLSFNYFLILAGNTDAVKADRMVTRFVANALAVRNVPQAIAETLVREASAVLRPEFPNLTPSLLDNKIWNFQRKQDEKPSAPCLVRAVEMQ